MSNIEALVLQALCDCDMTSFTGPKCEDGEFSNLVTLENYKYFDIQYWLTTSFFSLMTDYWKELQIFDTQYWLTTSFSLCWLTIEHNNLLLSILIDSRWSPILIRVRCSRMGKQDWFGQIPSRARQKPRHRGDMCVTVSSKIDRLEQLQYLPQYHLHSSSEKVKTSSLC